MRATWTDSEGYEITLSEFDEDGEQSDDLILGVAEKDAFGFTPEDAESFAAYLRAWALRQREGK